MEMISNLSTIVHLGIYLMTHIKNHTYYFILQAQHFLLFRNTNFNHQQNSPLSQEDSNL